MGELPVLAIHASWPHWLHHHSHRWEGLPSDAQRGQEQLPLGIPITDLHIHPLGFLPRTRYVLGNVAVVDLGRQIPR